MLPRAGGRRGHRVWYSYNKPSCLIRLRTLLLRSRDELLGVGVSPRTENNICTRPRTGVFRSERQSGRGGNAKSVLRVLRASVVFGPSYFPPVSFHRNDNSSAVSLTSWVTDTPALCPAFSS